MRGRGRRGLLGTMARTTVIAGTATAVSGSVARKQQAKAQATAQPQPAAAPTAQPQANEADQAILEIQKYSSLKDQGVITEEEFNAKKRQILGL